jgi:hypothetical protein
MPHVAHPSADALLSACSRADWAQTTRHWRALPPFARDLMAIDALLCSCEAIRASDSLPDRSTADAALRPVCASLVESAERLDLRPEMARALSTDFCRFGLFQCLVEIDRHERSHHHGSSLEDCLAQWIHIHFRSDARSYLVRFNLADIRAGMDSLRTLIRWAKPSDHAVLDRAAATCQKATSHFWPDEREGLAQAAATLLLKSARAAQALDDAEIKQAQASPIEEQGA